MARVRALAFVLVVVLGGCTYPERGFVDAIDTAWTAIGPEYTAYVEADTTLTPEAKATRLRTADMLRLTIEEAKAP